MTPLSLNRIALAALIALAVLCFAWEMWLAPLRPGGSTLALKAAPLMLALPGLLRGRRYTHQWMTLLSLAYLAEGLVRATSDRGFSATLAALEVMLAGALFLSCAYYAKATRGQPR